MHTYIHTYTGIHTSYIYTEREREKERDLSSRQSRWQTGGSLSFSLTLSVSLSLSLSLPLQLRVLARDGAMILLNNTRLHLKRGKRVTKRYGGCGQKGYDNRPDASLRTILNGKTQGNSLRPRGIL